MNLLYITADSIGAKSGGGQVTLQESEALRDLGPTLVLGREQLGIGGDIEPDPWGWDVKAVSAVKGIPHPKLCHFYAGTFSNTVEWLKRRGCVITFTAAAHDVKASKLAHESLGIPYDKMFPHLVQPDLWKRYLAGYAAADVLVCPSQHSAGVMRGFGCTNRIEIIPHGVDIPEKVSPPPSRFQVGYLGAYAPDKGIIYLLQAWEKLDYKDAILVLGGRDSAGQFVGQLIDRLCPNSKGSISRIGWVDKISNFFDMVSLYVQPSVTEGFGIEVLESLAHNRPVLCSRGAGAVDVVPEWYRYDPFHVSSLAIKIDEMKMRMAGGLGVGYPGQEIAREYTWNKIRQRYLDLWKELLV